MSSMVTQNALSATDTTPVTSLALHTMSDLSDVDSISVFGGIALRDTRSLAGENRSSIPALLLEQLNRDCFGSMTEELPVEAGDDSSLLDTVFIV